MIFIPSNVICKCAIELPGKSIVIDEMNAELSKSKDFSDISKGESHMDGTALWKSVWAEENTDLKTHDDIQPTNSKYCESNAVKPEMSTTQSTTVESEHAMVRDKLQMQIQVVSQSQTQPRPGKDIPSVNLLTKIWNAAPIHENCGKWERPLMKRVY